MTALPYRYAAHGLGIHSQEPLEHRQSPTAPCDVALHFDGGTAPTVAGPGEMLIRYERDVIFRVSSGRRVTAFTNPPITQSTAQCFASGALAVLLLQRGVPVLHASCVRVNGTLAAFVAPSGNGKSTIAGALVARGHDLYADDFIAFSDNGSVHRGFPTLHLWTDAADATGLGSSAARTVCQHPDARVKVAIDIPFAHAAEHNPRDSNDDAPLIFFLEYGERDEITKLSPWESLYLLLSNAYCVSLIDGEELPSEFGRWSALAGRLNSFRLTRRRDIGRVACAAEMLESCISGMTSHELVHAAR